MGNERRRSSARNSYRGQSYVDGNTVRQVQAVPKRQPRPRTDRHASQKTNKNRAKALQTGRWYVIFLAMVSVATLLVCVQFLKLKSTVTGQLKTIASLETELTTLKAENDALYDKTMSSVDMNFIKETAINELGMNYATADQIQWFNTSGTSYFRQYQDVPDSK